MSKYIGLAAALDDEEKMNNNSGGSFVFVGHRNAEGKVKTVNEVGIRGSKCESGNAPLEKLAQDDEEREDGIQRMDLDVGRERKQRDDETGEEMDIDEENEHTDTATEAAVDTATDAAVDTATDAATDTATDAATDDDNEATPIEDESPTGEEYDGEDG